MTEIIIGKTLKTVFNAESQKLTVSSEIGNMNVAIATGTWMPRAPKQVSDTNGLRVFDKAYNFTFKKGE